MTTEQKLNVHLEYIVMPEGVPLTAKEVLELCDEANYSQRYKAVERARANNPLLLPEEEREAQKWLDAAL